MKKNIIPYLFMFLAAFVITSCDDDDGKTCEQEEICANNSVTACCDESTCTYEHNGQEYTEDQLDQLAQDIGCTSSSAAPDSEKSSVIESLKGLAARARAN